MSETNCCPMHYRNNSTDKQTSVKPLSDKEKEYRPGNVNPVDFLLTGALTMLLVLSTSTVGFLLYFS